MRITFFTINFAQGFCLIFSLFSFFFFLVELPFFILYLKTKNSLSLFFKEKLFLKVKLSLLEAFPLKNFSNERPLFGKTFLGGRPHHVKTFRLVVSLIEGLPYWMGDSSSF